MALGKTVKALRESRGWTLKDLSKRSGVSVGTIGALEVRDSVRSEYAPQLAQGLGVPLTELMPVDQLHTDATVNVTGVEMKMELGQVTATGSIQDVLDAALVAELARRIKAIPREQREPLRNEVSALVMSPDSEETRAALTHYLTFGDERLPTTTTEMIEKNRENHAAKSVTGKDSVRG